MNGNTGAVSPFEDLVSVSEAAKLLRVSESTVWRWINHDVLPSYRVGFKRVYVRRTELAPLIQPARARGDGRKEAAMQGWSAPMSPRTPGIDEIALARALHKKYLDVHGGVPLPESWRDINEARDERSLARE